ncbi:MAG: BON domain-containing protein [Chitinophagaceae bacterium]
MKKSNIFNPAIITIGICIFFSSCMNSPAKSVTSDSTGKKMPFDTTAAQTVIAPADSLAIAVRDVIAKYPGVKADVKNGEVLLTGEIDGLKLQYLITDINTLRPKKVMNKIKVKRSKRK